MASQSSRFAEIAIPTAVRGTFTYRVPEELVADVVPGVRVEVPFGARLTTGFVLRLADEAPADIARIREIREVLDEEHPALLPEIVELCEWASDYYLAPIGEVLRSALPANMSARGKRRATVVATDDELGALISDRRLQKGDLSVVDAIRGGTRDVARLGRAMKNARAALGRLREAGAVRIEDDLRDNEGVRYDRFVILQNDEGELSSKQSEVVDALRRGGGVAIHSALVDAGLSASSISTLHKKGVVAIESRARRHTLDGFFGGMEPSPLGELDYSDEQRHAIDSVRASLGKFAAFLLQGVTGSGKTEVYIEIMREAVRRGGQAIVLVPEISLTPALAARLKERFDDRIAILHSGLSPSERYDQWWRARRGEVDVAIGPRSALFTPFPRLGVIIVDEEGDGAYKQEETPRYNARDLAVVRARIRGIPIVLGSATPSLESRENTEKGKYTLLKLDRRVESRPLPEVEVLDIRGERGEKEDRGLIMFSGRLREELGRVFDTGEQAIILMNRRGYAPFLLCRQCENDFRCRDCSVTMTVHRREGLLICHYCGMRKPIPERCPACSGEVMQPIGFGTEKVEERFRQYFPAVPVEVLDRDSIRKKGELVRILDRFRRGETRCLIGTQMLSKGHHFPGVTLTAVINADSILGYPDFRSAEKTFYLLTQVAGRSGRGTTPGRVVVQTGFPSHYAIQHVVRHDYDGFFASEIEFRRKFRYPPVAGLIAILIRGEELSRVEKAALALGKRLEERVRAIADARLQGPAPAPLARIKGVFRYQVLVRSAERAKLRRAVDDALQGALPPGVEVIVDVDPINIL
ncbi:MAG: primosomal protein N' [Thermoanaerobaculia bacterium]|nr:primosomal protein N' [Thermoanaerobaculia bacterium]